MINYKKLTKPYQEQALLALKAYCSINSVFDSSTISRSAPYGKGVKEALDYIGDLAKTYGFEVDKCDGRCVEISFGDTTKDYIGIFAHADVVPSGEGWEFGAFNPTIKDGKLIARGTSDDKGPGISSLFALKALKDNGLLNDFSVKLVIGGDEERGSSCLEYYFHTLNKPQPFLAFTPDADFPLIYGEKGVTNYVSKLETKLGPIKSIKAGVAANVVIEKCIVLLPKDLSLIEFLNKNNVKHSFIEKDGDYEISFFGKAAHGSIPEFGINAATIAFKTLGEFYKIKVLSDIAFALADTTGKNFDGYSYSEELHNTTYNLGLASYDNGILSITINYRFPENAPSVQHIASFDKATGLVSTYKEIGSTLLFDTKSDLVRTLFDVYVKESKDKKHKPYTIGGGTYAKEVHNCVAFGNGYPDTDNLIHQIDEFVLIKEFNQNIAIYAHAIAALGNLLTHENKI